MFSLMQSGGPLMWPILVASVIALAVFLERTIQYRRQTINVGEFLKGV